MNGSLYLPFFTIMVLILGHFGAEDEKFSDDKDVLIDSGQAEETLAYIIKEMHALVAAYIDAFFAEISIAHAMMNFQHILNSYYQRIKQFKLECIDGIPKTIQYTISNDLCLHFHLSGKKDNCFLP